MIDDTLYYLSTHGHSSPLVASSLTMLNIEIIDRPVVPDATTLYKINVELYI